MSRGIDFAHTTKAHADRLAKATTLAEFMLDTRFVREPADDKERRSVERAAMVGHASNETWSLALSLWRERR